MALSTDEILDAIAEMSVMDIVSLVEAMEEKFGVSAAAAGGDKKVNVIKVVRAVTGLGLKEAKAVVDGAPGPVKEGATKDEAEDIKKQIEEAGGAAELK